MKKILLAFLLFAFASFAQSAIHSVTLTWTWTQGNGAAATGFNVYRSTTAAGPFALVGSTSATVFTYTDSTVATLPVGPFYYYVAAFNTPSNLSNPSAVIGVTPAIVINAPASIGATIQ